MTANRKEDSITHGRVIRAEEARHDSFCNLLSCQSVVQHTFVLPNWHCAITACYVSFLIFQINERHEESKK